MNDDDIITAADVEPVDQADGPAPFLSGTFALYEASGGAVVLVTDIPGRGVDRQVIPAAMVKAGLALAGGKLPFGGLAGGIKGLLTGKRGA